MKPEEHILFLINAVSQPSRIQSGRIRQIISLNQYAEPMSFILHEGIAALYRGRDNMLLSNIKAPLVFGLNLLSSTNSDIYIQARGGIRYELLKRTDFADAIRTENLWENLANIYMFNAQKFLELNFTISGVPTYEQVCNSLIALMNENDELRLTTNACDYIQEKTLLSRSGIMKMLSDLKQGGHIDVQRGVLIAINKLPEKY
ncbi:helix-turn-helix domain-containing protein [Enterobacter cloacae complex sp. Mu1197]|uniref:Helix-turn-helix domain-containing protein n=1 Tax=Enterobacter cloacae complex sp. Mu1197 TaxID=3152302 RepID=A0AAU7FTJ3_9ENTR